MKTFIYAISFITALVSAHAQNSDVPEWRALVKVVDDTGQPVPGANVTVGYYVAPPSSNPTAIATDAKRGLTDKNGLFSASERNGSIDLFFGASKDGYYRAHAEHAFDKFKSNDPAKWNPSVTLLLKKIGNPIPMYAKRIRQGPPVANKPVGYDLHTGDWVPPFGKGENADIIFTVHLDQTAGNDDDYKLVVTFPNPGDGIQPFAVSELEKTSGLRSPHEAPESGYDPQWTKTRNQHPGQQIEDGLEMGKELNFFFRVRTILDENGNVKSARYGKIYGEFMDFQYLLNPAVNSRNVEFDPAKNLMKRLGPSEGVSTP